MTFKKAVIALTVYEPTSKKGKLYRAVSIRGKPPCRRITATQGASLQEWCNKLLEGAPADEFTEMKHEEEGCQRPMDADEFEGMDVARVAHGFVEGKVCFSTLLPPASFDFIYSRHVFRSHASHIRVHDSYMTLLSVMWSCVGAVPARFVAELPCQYL